MLQIAFLLAGATFVRKAAPFFMVAGLLWGGLGLAIFLDGLQGGLHFPLHVFGLFLLLDSLVSLALGSAAKGTQRGIFYFKGGVFLLIAILILSGRHDGTLVLAIVFGIAYFITGLLPSPLRWWYASPTGVAPCCPGCCKSCLPFPVPAFSDRT